MSGNTIDAKLVVAADFSDAIRQLQQLRRESQQTGSAVVAVQQAATRAAGGAGAPAGGAGNAPGVAAQAQAVRQAAAERRAMLRAQREAEREANRQRRAEEREVTREVRAQTNLQKQAYRQLPAQITDITTSIASGMPIWMVAIQQGGQIRDSFGGIGQAASALLKLLTPLRIAIGFVGGALAAVGIGAYQGYKETDRLNKALALTGNVGNLSVGQISTAARRLSRETGAAIGDVRDILATLAATGNYTSANLDEAARAVVALRKLTGQSAEEAVQAFEAQGDGITQWSLRANRAYNFLTAEKLAYIRSLEAEGRAAEATQFVNDELAQTLEQRAIPAVDKYGKLWAAVTAAFSGFWDRVKENGRTELPEDRLLKLQAQIRGALDAPRNISESRLALRDRLVAEWQAEVDQILQDQRRAAERAATVRAENDKILRDTKAYQDSLSALNKAGADKRLAALEADLDAEAAAVRAADAAGLARAEETARQLNEIELRRLRAREANLNAEQQRVESRPVDEKDLDGNSKKAAIAALEKQLIEVQGRIRSAATEGQAIVSAAALESSRKDAQAYAEVWKRAYEQTRDLAQQNADQEIAEITDPMERAAAAGEARARRLRGELDALFQELRTQIATAEVPGTADALQDQLGKLEGQADRAISNAQRLGTLASVVDSIAVAFGNLNRAESQIDDMAARGAITAEDASKRKKDARERELPVIERLIDLQKKLARTDGEVAAAADNETRAREKGMTDEERKQRERVERLARDRESLKKTGEGSFGDMFTDFITGAASAAEAFKAFIATVAREALNLAGRRLGAQLADSLWPDGGGGGLLGSIGSFLIDLFHTGGVVGQSAMRMSRRVAPAAVASLQVLHTGGIAGMVRPNEQLALLEKGEEVLTTADPRHVSNFRNGPIIGSLVVNVPGEGSGASAADVKIANQLGRMIDKRVTEVVQTEMRPGGLLARR